jgi:hypothetical protein
VLTPRGNCVLLFTSSHHAERQNTTRLHGSGNSVLPLGEELQRVSIFDSHRNLTACDAYVTAGGHATAQSAGGGQPAAYDGDLQQPSHVPVPVSVLGVIICADAHVGVRMSGSTSLMCGLMSSGNDVRIGRVQCFLFHGDLAVAVCLCSSCCRHAHLHDALQHMAAAGLTRTATCCVPISAP